MIFIGIATAVLILEIILYRKSETTETDECDTCPFPRCDKKCIKK